MKVLKALGMVAGLFMLGACTTHYIDDQLGPIESMPGQGSAFAMDLHKDYIALARIFQQHRFLSEALFWGDKSAKAGTGVEVPWENVDTQGLPPTALAQAKVDESRLKAAIADGAKTSDPEDLAMAQVSFDCMIRDWCPPIYGDILKGCRDRFDAAMARLMRPKEPAAADYWLFFDFNKFNVRADAAAILDRAVSAIRSMGSKSVVLTGHTDTVGTIPYNLALSIKRANSAKTYLVQHGVPANSIITIGKGKTDLRVPTPDQVREQENRNVHIELK
jgi:outer membrane protein OmpA-like peptidoglycan-associated protein